MKLVCRIENYIVNSLISSISKKVPLLQGKDQIIFHQLEVHHHRQVTPIVVREWYPRQFQMKNREKQTS
jgi:hypothetical protein